MTQGELEQIPIPLQQIYWQLEQDLMEEIIVGIKANGWSSQATDYRIDQLRRMGNGADEIQKKIQHALNMSDEEIEAALSDAVYEAWYDAERVYKVAGFKPLPFEENEELQSIMRAAMKQAQKECHNISGSYGFAFKGASGRVQYKSVRSTYNDMIDKAILAIQTGAYDHDTVLRRAVKSLTASGLRYIDYESGVSTKVDVAARRAIMTGFNQVQAHINDQLAEDIGTDMFEVSWHIGARPSHQVWQGRVYSRQELEDVCGLGDVAGLCGANCYHRYYPYIEGLSIRAHSDAWLDEQNAKENEPVSYGNKTYTRYEALQEQRRQERKIRAQRESIYLMKKGDASKEAVKAERARYKVQIQKYRDFSEKMDLPEQFKRVYQDGLETV